MKNTPHTRGVFVYSYTELGKVRRNELGHFEHVDSGLAAKDLLQFFVRINIALIGGILQVIFFDVFPQLLHHF